MAPGGYELRYVQTNTERLQCYFVAENDWDGYGCFVRNRKLCVRYMRYGSPDQDLIDEGPMPGGPNHTEFYRILKQNMKQRHEIGNWLWCTD